MFDDFLVRAVFAGIGVAIAAAPLGCMVVWRRMAYFGDATAHAAILGIAVALGFGISVFVGVLVISLCMAFTVSTLSERGLGMDTLLGVLAHSSLAIGLVAVSMLDGVRVDLMGYLFGDILAVNMVDLMLIWGGVLGVVVLLTWRWANLLTATINPDLAFSEGINPKVEQLVLTLALALVVAVSIKVVGALLIGAMLVIPAASARVFSRTPETMVFFAAFIGVVAVLCGIQGSIVWDTPTGPTIVSVAAMIFVFVSAFRIVKVTRA